MNTLLIRLACAASLALAATLAQAQVTVEDAWVRATVPAQRASGAFLQLRAAHPMRLVGATSPVAGLVELHHMDHSGGMMRMEAVTAISLPAGTSVDLAAAGYHVMLLELKQQLKPGASVPLTLAFEAQDGKRLTLTATATVKSIATAAHP